MASVAQVMCRRPGTLMIAAAPNGLQPLSAMRAGSHASAARRPAGLRGMLVTSPLGGTNIRQRQSSVTADTQTPVRSIGALARGVVAVWVDVGGCCAPARASGRTRRAATIDCVIRISEGALMRGPQVLAQQIAAEVAVEVAPHRM